MTIGARYQLVHSRMTSIRNSMHKARFQDTARSHFVDVSYMSRDTSWRSEPTVDYRPGEGSDDNDLVKRDAGANSIKFFMFWHPRVAKIADSSAMHGAHFLRDPLFPDGVVLPTLFDKIDITY